MEINIVINPDAYEEVCDLIHRSQRAETEATMGGIV